MHSPAMMPDRKTLNKKRKMNFYDQICNLAAERWSDNQRYIAGDRDRAACLAKATDSVFCHLETEVDSGRLSAADEAECRRQAGIVLEVYGFTVAEILLPSGSASAFSEILEDIAQVAGIDHQTALRVHETAEKELALYAQALAVCPPDGHALLSAMVIGAKAKAEAFSLLCQRLREKTVAGIAERHDAAILADADGDVAIQRRIYDADGILVVRFRPDNCDFFPIAGWESMTEEEVSRAIC